MGIFISKFKQEQDRLNDIFKKEDEQLSFWIKQGEDALKELKKAEDEFRTEDVKKFAEQYKTCMLRYTQDFKTIAERYGAKVVIRQYKANGDEMNNDDNYFK